MVVHEFQKLIIDNFPGAERVDETLMGLLTPIE